jgi:hypothetical protein
MSETPEQVFFWDSHIQATDFSVRYTNILIDDAPGGFGLHLRPRRCGKTHNAIEPIIGIRLKKIHLLKNDALFLSLNLITYISHFFTSSINFGSGEFLIFNMKFRMLVR